MIYPKIFLFYSFLVVLHLPLFAQNCHCNITEVENNTVSPCQIIVGTVDTVFNTQEFVNAINQINAEGGNKTILIADGVYPIASPSWYPFITANDVVFRSLSGNRDAVIITGTGMGSVNPNVENGFYFVGNNITIADLTIKEVGNHAIATQGDNLFVHNVKIQNTYEQMLKGTSAGDGADNGTVQCSLFEYPAGIGPQFYIGGLDIHEGENWIVRDNIFKNISSPSGSLAEHAVHFWNSSANNTVERNWIINCDRGIGFGLGNSPNQGGLIKNNMIYNDGSNPFNDVGIGLESSPNTKVFNNTIFIEYPNAIEYRFPATTNVDITNNLTNKLIKSREDGQASVTTNYTEALSVWFENVSAGNLRLNANHPQVVDVGTDLSNDVEVDFDQTPRPQSSAFDIGAHEFVDPLSSESLTTTFRNIELFPNPAMDYFYVSAREKLNGNAILLKVLNSTGKIVLLKKFLDISQPIHISTADFAPGVYFIHISQQKFTACRKVVVIE